MSACKRCDTEFDPQQEHQVFCSAQCRRKWWKEETEKRQKQRREPFFVERPAKACAVCGETFLPSPHCFHEQAVCSKACQTKWKWKKRNKRAMAKRIAARATHCLGCGEYLAQRYKRRFCSDSCCDRYYTRISAEQTRTRAEARWRELGPPPLPWHWLPEARMCKVCRSVFIARSRNHLLCGAEPCKVAWRQQRNRDRYHWDERYRERRQWEERLKDNPNVPRPVLESWFYLRPAIVEFNRAIGRGSHHGSTDTDTTVLDA